MRKKVLLTIILLLCCVMLPVRVMAQPVITAESAVLMDMSSGQVLYQKNIDKRMYPASTTKILTTLIAIKKANLNDMVKASWEACRADGSAVGLQEGEIFKLEDLLYAVMLPSANDAAAAVAEHIGGSVEGFARIMNEEARAMGAVNSNFVTPHGLHDPKHYTTAGDLALIAREAMKNSIFREYAGTYSHKIKRTLPRPVNGIPQEDFVNLNRLLWPGNIFEYKGVTGIKTGYTDEARRCLVASAERNGREILVVVMKTENFDMYRDTITLLDYGFNDFKQVVPVNPGDEVGSAKVRRGVAGEVGAVASGKFSYNVPINDKASIEKRVNLDGNMAAPVKKGQKVGVMTFLKDGKGIGSVDLVAGRDVDRDPLFHWWYGLVILALLYIYISARARARRRRYVFRKQRWY